MSQDDYIKSATRYPPALHARLHDSAEQSGRSFNAEVLARLLASYEADPVEKRLTAIERVLARVEKLLK
jgi:hypothetical protein